MKARKRFYRNEIGHRVVMPNVLPLNERESKTDLRKGMVKIMDSWGRDSEQLKLKL